MSIGDNIKVDVSEFEISDDVSRIYLKKHLDGRATIYTGQRKEKFLFCQSKPEVIKRIALLLLKAAEVAELTMIPSSTIKITAAGTAKQILGLVEALEDHEDVQQVYSNFDIPSEILEQSSIS